MRSYWFWLFAFTLPLIYGLDLIENERGFEIYVNGIKLVEHSDEFPFLFVGIGELSFKEYEGNFHVEQRLSEKAPVLKYEISSEDNHEIKFTTRDRQKDPMHRESE